MQQQTLVASLYNCDRHLWSSAEQHVITAKMRKWQDQKVEEEVVFPAYAKSAVAALLSACSILRGGYDNNPMSAFFANPELWPEQWLDDHFLMRTGCSGCWLPQSGIRLDAGAAGKGVERSESGLEVESR
eukprot:g18756.t1